MERKWVVVLAVVIGCALLAPVVLVALGVAVWLFMPSAPAPPHQVPAPAPAAAAGGAEKVQGEREPGAAQEPGNLAAGRRHADLRKSRENLRRIGRALGGGGQFMPPAFRAVPREGAVSGGLSWRVYVLPSFGDDEARLFRQFKLDEPWDSPHNLQLLPLMPSVYAPVGGVKAEPGHTFYQVFTGPGALYSTPESWARVTDVTDGTSYTLLAVEGAEAVPWTKPRDVHFDADPRKPLPKLGGLFDGDCNACLCDGAVLFIPRKAPERVVRALITRAGGEELRLSQLGLTAAEWGELLENGGPQAAHQALLELGPEAVAAARPALRGALASPEAGLYAADLLSRQQLDGKEAIPTLIAGLDARDLLYFPSLPGQPVFVAHGLGRYGREAVPALVRALPRQGAVQGLAEVGPEAKDAVPRLVDLLDREDKPGKDGAFLRAWVIHALGRLGPQARSAAPSLTRLLKSYADGADIPHSGMHVGPVVRALGEIGPDAKEAVPVLTALLEKAPSDQLTGGLHEDDVDVAAALVRIDPDNKLALGQLNGVCKPAVPPRPALEVAKAAFALARRDPKDPQTASRLIAVMPGVRPEFRSAAKGAGFDRDVERWFFYQDEVFCADVARWLKRFGPGAREAVER
jgi:hypothetical protein